MLSADVVNNGTVNFEDDNIQLTKVNGSFTNNAIVNIPIGGAITQLSPSAGSHGTFTQAGGTLTLNGGITLFSDTFTFDGGTIAGSNAVLLIGSELNIGSGSTGAGTFELNGGNTFSGDVSESQTLRIHATTGSAGVTAASGFRNHGTIVLDNESALGFSTALTVTTGTLINESTGTITFEESAGEKHFSANLVNNGTVSIEADTHFVKAPGAVTNNSLFHITSSGSLTMNGGAITFTQDAGQLLIDGFFGPPAVFNFNGGDILGNAPEFNHTTLNLNTTNAATFLFTSGGNLITGNIAADQTILYERRGGPFLHFLELAGTTNFGTIRVTTLNDGLITTLNALGAGFTNAGLIDILGTTRIDVFNETFINTGVIQIAGPDGNVIDAELDNRGTFLVEAVTTLGVAGFAHTNDGTWTIDNNSALLIRGDSLTNNESGTIGGTGTLNTSFSIFTNNGTLAPGSSPGLFTVVGGYIQGATGNLLIELAGLQPGSAYDQLSISGTAILDGSLTISLLNGFVPQLGTAYEIVNANIIQGGFAKFDGFSPGNTDLIFRQVLDDPKKIVLEVQKPVHDLEVVGVTVPKDGIAGEGAVVLYQVRNNGDPTNVGGWRDAIYLSKDKNFDPAKDSLLKRVDRVGDLGHSESRDFAEPVTLPLAEAGNWFFIVVTDTLRQVADANLKNNAKESEFTTAIDFNILPIGGQVIIPAGNFNRGFRIFPNPGGGDLVVTFNAEPGVNVTLTSADGTQTVKPRTDPNTQITYFVVSESELLSSYTLRCSSPLGGTTDDAIIECAQFTRTKILYVTPTDVGVGPVTISAVGVNLGTTTRTFLRESDNPTNTIEGSVERLSDKLGVAQYILPNIEGKDNEETAFDFVFADGVGFEAVCFNCVEFRRASEIAQQAVTITNHAPETVRTNLPFQVTTTIENRFNSNTTGGLFVTEVTNPDGSTSTTRSQVVGERNDGFINADVFFEVVAEFHENLDPVNPNDGELKPVKILGQVFQFAVDEFGFPTNVSGNPQIRVILFSQGTGHITVEFRIDDDCVLVLRVDSEGRPDSTSTTNPAFTVDSLLPFEEGRSDAFSPTLGVFDVEGEVSKVLEKLRKTNLARRIDVGPGFRQDITSTATTSQSGDVTVTTFAVNPDQLLGDFVQGAGNFLPRAVFQEFVAHFFDIRNKVEPNGTVDTYTLFGLPFDLTPGEISTSQLLGNPHIRTIDERNDLAELWMLFQDPDHPECKLVLGFNRAPVSRILGHKTMELAAVGYDENDLDSAVPVQKDGDGRPLGAIVTDERVRDVLRKLRLINTSE